MGERPFRPGEPGFGVAGKPGYKMVDDPDGSILTKTLHRTLLRVAGEDEVTAYSYGSIQGVNVNTFICYTKSKQDFLNYATDWEKRYSILTRPERGRFTVVAGVHHRADPVLDENLTVVGHYGWFKGDQIWVPRAAPKAWGQGELSVQLGLKDLVNMGVPVLVRMETVRDSSAWSTGEQLYRLLTDVEGRVLLCTNYDIVGLESADEVLFVLALIYPAGGLVVAGAKAAAGRAATGIRSLIRRFSSNASKRPKLPKDVISGDPPVVRVGSFGEPGNLFGHITIDGKVVYHVRTIKFTGAEDAAQQATVRTARLAHREMIVRAAEEARKKGQKEFILRGREAGPNFEAHANRLAAEVAVPGFGRRSSKSTYGLSDYDVILNVAKVLIHSLLGI